MKLRELEREITEKLKIGGLEQPAYECRQILFSLMKADTAGLLKIDNEEASDNFVQAADDWTRERLRGVPLAYLTGLKGFFKSEFRVGPGALVPRPESELIVEAALTRVREQNLRVLNIADLGAGTGCLGLSLLKEIPGAKLCAIEESPAAAVFFMQNAQSLELADRVILAQQSVESYSPNEKFELIVANPPYIPLGDLTVQKSVHDHEPHEALYSGTDGLIALRSWCGWAERNLAKGGIFVAEFGAGQTSQVKRIINDLEFKQLRVQKDLAGIDRVISAIYSR